MYWLFVHYLCIYYLSSPLLWEDWGVYHISYIKIYMGTIWKWTCIVFIGQWPGVPLACEKLGPSWIARSSLTPKSQAPWEKLNKNNTCTGWSHGHDGIPITWGKNLPRLGLSLSLSIQTTGFISTPSLQDPQKLFCCPWLRLQSTAAVTKH